MNYYTLTKRDIGRKYLRVFGCIYDLPVCIGGVKSADIGKRIYINQQAKTLQMESDEQLKERMKKNEARC